MNASKAYWVILPFMLSPAWATEPDSADILTARVQRLEAALADLRNASAPANSAVSNSASAFNPAIGMVLNGQYAYHSLDPNQYARAGFPLTGDAGPGAQGLSLGESEVSLSSPIDDKFDGQLTVALGSDGGQDEIGIEEAYVQSIALPWFLTLRAGRFLSNIGYLNGHHAHTDKFADRPLPYQAFLGSAYHDDGVQLQWVAPTDVFLSLNAELLRGQAFPSGGAAHQGAGAQTLALHAGGDIGETSSWLAGVSLLHSKAVASDDGFNGRNTLYIADATWKWAPQGNTNDGGITLRGEYFQDHRHGEYIDPAALAPNQPWAGIRQGFYAECIYRLSQQWEMGYRHDALRAAQNGPYASGFNPMRGSLMLTWRNSEFSLVRLQISEDRPDSAAQTANNTDRALVLQYQMTLGAHPAHQF